MKRTVSTPEPGIRARTETDCQRCGLTIHIGDRIIYRRGWAIHVTCAAGGDDQ